MPLETIAWADGRILHTRLLDHVFLEQGMRIDWFNHALPLLDALQRKNYPLILMDFALAPGGGSWDEELKKIMRGDVHFGEPDFSKVGEYTLRKIRESPSYRTTPLLVASIFDKRVDHLYPNAELRALTAGATAYINTLDCLPRLLVQRVKACLG